MHLSDKIKVALEAEITRWARLIDTNTDTLGNIEIKLIFVRNGPAPTIKGIFFKPSFDRYPGGH